MYPGQKKFWSKILIFSKNGDEYVDKDDKLGNVCCNFFFESAVPLWLNNLRTNCL